jgi:hypothetical protein
MGTWSKPLVDHYNDIGNFDQNVVRMFINKLVVGITFAIDFG